MIAYIKKLIQPKVHLEQSAPPTYDDICGKLMLLKNDFNNAEIGCPLRHIIFQKHHPVISTIFYEYVKFVLFGVKNVKHKIVLQHLSQAEEDLSTIQILYKFKKTVLDIWSNIYDNESLSNYPINSRIIINKALSQQFEKEMNRIIDHIANTIFGLNKFAHADKLAFITVAYMLKETYVTDAKAVLYNINGPISELKIPIIKYGITEYLTHQDCTDLHCKCHHCNNVSNDYNSLLNNLIEIILDAHYNEPYSTIHPNCHLRGLKKSIHLEAIDIYKKNNTQSETYAKLRQTIREQLESSCSITEVRRLWDNCSSHRSLNQHYCIKKGDNNEN